MLYIYFSVTIQMEVTEKMVLPEKNPPLLAEKGFQSNVQNTKVQTGGVEIK